MEDISQKNYIIYSRNLEELQNLGIEILEEYPFISAFLVKLTTEQYNLLKKINKTIFPVENQKVQSQIYDAKKFINVSKFYRQGFFGKGVTVAVIDTGVEPIFDLSIPFNRILEFKDFTSKSKRNPYDDNGHGTFVAGVIAGNGLLSFGKYSGVAPMSNLVILKSLNQKGEALSSTILESMDWIIKNKKKYGIKIVCMSFGSEALPINDPLSIGAEKMCDNGLIVVTACGNDGPDYGTITSPGISSKVITVGALDKLVNYPKVADFSSRGSRNAKVLKPDIVAPGTNVISNSREIGVRDYVEMSGTSVSTPIIAGVCALLCEKYPNFSVQQIKSKLFNFAVDIGASKYAQGRGAFVYR